MKRSVLYQNFATPDLPKFALDEILIIAVVMEQALTFLDSGWARAFDIRAWASNGIPTQWIRIFQKCWARPSARTKYCARSGSSPNPKHPSISKFQLRNHFGFAVSKFSRTKPLFMAWTSKVEGGLHTFL